MTLQGKKDKSMFSAVDPSRNDLNLIWTQENVIKVFEDLDRKGELDANWHSSVFASYNVLNTLDTYTDKSVNERIKRAIGRLEKLMRKYNVRGILGAR